MLRYSAIIIIYNPQSTGSSEKLARELKAALRQALPDQKIKLIATKYAGHAEELAYKHAKAFATPLVVSASGDGGYHEVINGLMRAQSEGAKPTAGLLPAGNANDHFHSVHDGDFVTMVVKHADRAIDILKLSGVRDKQPFERYAHSYIGLGLSPKVGKKLNQTKLNRLNEVWIVLKTLTNLKHIRITVGGKTKSYDSLVFTNIGRMAKVLNLAKESEFTDGKFEVSAIHHKNTTKLLSSLLRASVVGAQAAEQTNEFTFHTVVPTAIQLDGELQMLDAKSQATVTIERQVLHCIV